MHHVGPLTAKSARMRLILTVLLLIACLGCNRGTPPPASSTTTSPPSSASGTPGQNPAPDDTGDWVRPGKDYASTRFSTLDQITPETVKQLGVKGTFSTGLVRGHEAAPLVVNNTMYVVTPFPNLVYALDLTKPGAPAKWTYDPKTLGAAQGVACCDVVNRGASYDNGTIFFNTLDGRTIALDSETGKEKWVATLADINKGETITRAPLVASGKVFVGNSGGELGVRGWLTALNENDGTIAWRAYSTGPDKDVLIGPRFKPFYAKDRGSDLGIHTWPGEAWKTGGGAPWGWVSYDPGSNLVIYGTSNPGPWNADQRPGDNKWTAGLFARDANTGEAVWFYQMSPHDLWDYDGVNEQVFVDLPLNGTMRKAMLRADRDGYLYVLDRTTGEVISADPFVHVTSTHGIDLKTGKPIENESLHPTPGTVVRDVCPAAPGGKDWQPTAYSPVTGYLYIPSNNLCMDFEGVEANYIAGTPFVGANVRMYAGPGGNRGEFMAWDPVGRKKVWGVKENFPVWSGVVVTKGGVAFYGTMDGWFKAIDAKSGQELWKFKTGSGIIGQPITYRGPDGKQYVAVLAGVGGWSGAIVAGQLDPRDGTAALGFVNAMTDLPKATTPGGMLYIFGLP
jgi:PQQ-dependent dehydrogenase (methanol/ethanol family)